MPSLQSLYRGLAPGGYLIVDDYGALEECRRAVDDFRSEHGPIRSPSGRSTGRPCGGGGRVPSRSGRGEFPGRIRTPRQRLGRGGPGAQPRAGSDEQELVSCARTRGRVGGGRAPLLLVGSPSPRRWCSSTRTPRSSTAPARPRGARRPRRGRGGLRRRDRRAQHRLVGGLGHLGVVHHRYGELGGGELPSFTWNADEAPPYADRRGGHRRRLRARAVALGRCENLRFDESLGKLHGYDYDICLQAARPGRRSSRPTSAIHHHSLDLVTDVDAWIEAHMRIAEKWDGRIEDVGRRATTGHAGAPGRGRRAAAAARRRPSRCRHQGDDAARAPTSSQLAGVRGEPQLARTAPLRASPRCATSGCGPLVVQRLPNPLARERGLAAVAHAREPLGEGEGPRAGCSISWRAIRSAARVSSL